MNRKQERLEELAKAMVDTFYCDDDDIEGHEPHDGDFESCWACFARWALGKTR